MDEKPESRLVRIVVGDDQHFPDPVLLRSSCDACGVLFQKGDVVVQGTSDGGRTITSTVHEKCHDQSKYGPQV
jgi:hypothetical protein